MKKESLASSIMRPIFAVIMAFLMLIATNAFFMKTTLLNSKTWTDNINTKKLVKEMKNEFLYDSDISGDRDEIEDFYDAIVTEDMVNFVLEESFDAAFYGDNDFDSDELKDILNDSAEDFFDDYDVPRSEQRDFIDDAVDSVEEYIDEMSEENEDSPFVVIAKFRNSLTPIYTFSFITCAVLIVILLIVCRNKALPIKDFGLVFTISQFLNLIGAVGLSGIFISALSDFRHSAEAADSDDYAIDLLEGLIKNLSTKGIAFFGILFVIGVAIFIAGIIAVKAISRKADEEDIEAEY